MSQEVYLLASDQLFRVEELAVGSHSDFINDSWLQVNKDSTGNMLATAGLSKEGVEGIISTSESLVRWHLAIRLDSMLKAVKGRNNPNNFGTRRGENNV